MLATVIASTKGSSVTGIRARYGTMVPMSTARLGRYELAEIIGTGGVAEAWRASFGDASFRKTVVVKRVRPELRAQPELGEAFLREARIAQRLQHGNVVQVLDVGDDDGVPYIVLEHVDGCSLQTLLDGGVLPVDVALHVAEQVALALQHAHAAEDEHGAPLQLVHRDVTPGNVLLSKSGVVKLGDFGIARVRTSGSDTLPGFIKGTPIYLAPEQAAGRPVDARADVYSLGLVLRRMLVGDGELAIDDELAAIVLHATEPAVKDRLASAAELRTRLQSYRAAHGIGDGTDALAQRVRAAIGAKPRKVLALDDALALPRAAATRQLAPPSSSSSRSLWLGLVAVLVLAIAGVALAWDRDEAPSIVAADDPAPPDPPPTTIVPDDRPAIAPRDPPASDPIVEVPVADKPSKPKRAMGRLDVANLTPWADVKVDGKSWGRAPVARSLGAGEHRVELYNPDVGPAVRTIVIEAGKTTELKSWR